MTMQFDIERFEAVGLNHDLGDYWLRVPDQIALLNRFVYLEWAAARIIAGWLPAAEELEWKCEMSHMIWHNMNIAERILTRREELSGNRKIAIPNDALQTFVQEVSAADSYFAFVAGFLMEVTRDLIRSYEDFCEALDPIFDAPTLEIIAEILPKKRQQLKWAVELIHEASHEKMALESIIRWRKYAKQYLLYLGGVDEKQDKLALRPECPITQAYGPAPSKRSRPKDLILGDLSNPPKEFADNIKIFMWHYCTEIQVLDPMSYLFYGIDDMPFEFYVDLSRHIWDESRHHRMGMRRLQQMGYKLKEIPLPYGEDPMVDMVGYYSSLTMLGESCSFTRKKKSMDAYYATGDVLSGMTAEIDIVDERSHVRFGKKWTPQLFKQKLGIEITLDEIIRNMLKDATADHSDFNDLTEEQKDKISHFAFCGRVEFKYLSYEN